MELSTLTVVISVLLLAAALRSFAGFGDALVAMPLLSLVIGVRIATPLVGLTGLTLAIVLASRHRRSILVAPALRLVVATMVGVPVGVLLLVQAHEPLLRKGLGVLLVTHALRNFAREPVSPRSAHPAWAWPAGLLAGVLGGAYNTSGPPVIVYASSQRWEPEQIRATLQGYFIFSSVAVATSHGVAGLWTHHVLVVYLAALPAIAAGLILGAMLSERVDATRFRRSVYSIVMVLGVVLFAGA